MVVVVVVGPMQLCVYYCTRKQSTTLSTLNQSNLTTLRSWPWWGPRRASVARFSSEQASYIPPTTYGEAEAYLGFKKEAISKKYFLYT